MSKGMRLSEPDSGRLHAPNTRTISKNGGYRHEANKARDAHFPASAGDRARDGDLHRSPGCDGPGTAQWRKPTQGDDAGGVQGVVDLIACRPARRLWIGSTTVW